MAATVKNVSARHPFTQRRSALIPASGLLMLFTTMIATNPGKPAYLDYASERLLEKLKQECNELEANISISGGLTIPTQDLCKSSLESADLVGRGAVKLVVNGTTERQNFGIFSIYTTQLTGRTFKTVGIGGHFMMFYSE